MKESHEKYYTIDITSKSTQEDVVYGMNELLKITLELMKDTDVRVTVEPTFKSDEMKDI